MPKTRRPIELPKYKLRRILSRNKPLERRIAKIERLIKFLEYRRDGLSNTQIAKRENISITRVVQLCDQGIAMASIRLGDLAPGSVEKYQSERRAILDKYAQN